MNAVALQGAKQMIIICRFCNDFYNWFLGTFGQPKAWDINEPVTYQHPMAPYDVLVDPQTLANVPKTPVATEETKTQEKKKEENEKVENKSKEHKEEKVQFDIW